MDGGATIHGVAKSRTRLSKRLNYAPIFLKKRVMDYYQ